ncbi:hypothetical protein F7725_012857 [Dissostichus mawsoni]|uniref:Uncharacterized protein n=1 Tax=Dissostichus mawsoni TaxID=36200 RepID=A0A7J5YNU8_DISMA|nr:hypothetical protein F7725_012857 [Dissostichus mawsoni]
MMGGDSGARGNMGEREETEIEKGMGSGGWESEAGRLGAGTESVSREKEGGSHLDHRLSERKSKRRRRMGEHTDTHIGTVRQSMELQCGAVIVLIIALSAAPVRQTVRGSLGGVPQGSAIGLLEKAPPYRTPTPLGMARAASPAPFLHPTTIWTEQPILQYISSKNNLYVPFLLIPAQQTTAPEVTRSLVLGQKRPGGVDPWMGTCFSVSQRKQRTPPLKANLETPETTHVIELLFLL